MTGQMPVTDTPASPEPLLPERLARAITLVESTRADHRVNLVNKQNNVATGTNLL